MKRLILVLLLAAPAYAADLTPPQAARAQALYTEIKCLTCAGESIADSPSDFAADMRTRIRDDIAAGASDDVIRDRLRAQFGDAVMMRPPFGLSTLVLWFGPLFVVFIGAYVLWRRARINTL